MGYNTFATDATGFVFLGFLSENQSQRFTEKVTIGCDRVETSYWVLQLGFGHWVPPWPSLADSLARNAAEHRASRISRLSFVFFPSSACLFFSFSRFGVSLFRSLFRSIFRSLFRSF